jgi:hypothetical protein
MTESAKTDDHDVHSSVGSAEIFAGDDKEIVGGGVLMSFSSSSSSSMPRAEVVTRTPSGDQIMQDQRPIPAPSVPAPASTIIPAPAPIPVPDLPRVSTPTFAPGPTKKSSTTTVPFSASSSTSPFSLHIVRKVVPYVVTAPDGISAKYAKTRLYSYQMSKF